MTDTLRLRRSLAALALVVLAAPACIGRGGAGAAEGFRAAEVSGSVLARRPGDEVWRSLRSGHRVVPGSEVKTEDGAWARLVREGGPEVELGPQTDVRVISSGHLSVARGHLLGRPAGVPIRFESRGVSARGGRGVLRFDRELSLRVGVYEGEARVELLGSGLDVPALREVVVAGGTLPREPAPLQLSPEDRWDRRILGPVLDLDRELTQYGRGFDAQYAGQATGPAFFARFVGVPQVAFVGGALSLRPDPSDVLIGLIYALAVSRRSGGALDAVFAELLDLRRRGATWGLIARMRGLTPADVIRALVDAISRGTSPPPPPPGPSGRAGPGGSSGPGPGETPSPKPKPKPSPSPSPSASPTPCDPVQQLLGRCTSGSSGGGGSSAECDPVRLLVDPNC